MGEINWSDYMVGESPEMQRLLANAERALNTYSTILIIGATGTGKNHLAEAIHDASPLTRKHPFMVINCGALSDLESTLLNEAPSSASSPIRQARNGSLFLDEIQDTPMENQRRLVRLLQEITDWGPERRRLRIIASSREDLDSAVKRGTFRDDLYFRLKVIQLWLPLLKSRKEDIPILVDRFLSDIPHMHQIATRKQLSGKALDILIQYSWPGNVRELRNCIERLVLLCDSDTIDIKDLPREISLPERTGLRSIPFEMERFDAIENLSIKLAIKHMERGFIKEALRRTKNNHTHASKMLQISHRALLYKIKEYNLLED